MENASRPLQALAIHAMAYEAVLLALMQTHPQQEVLSAAIRRTAVEISTNAMTGQQMPGALAAFDAKIAQLLSALSAGS